MKALFYKEDQEAWRPGEPTDPKQNKDQIEL